MTGRKPWAVVALLVVQAVVAQMTVDPAGLGLDPQWGKWLALVSTAIAIIVNQLPALRTGQEKST